MTSTENYSKSLRRRMRVLFSPLRSTLLVAAVVFAVVLNIMLVRNGGQPEWVGPLSVVPLLAFAGWTLATDYSQRRAERAKQD